MGILFLEIGKSQSVEKLHHQVRHIAATGLGYAEIRNVDNVRVAEAAACLRLTLKTGEKVRIGGPPRRDHFHRDDASGSQVRGQVDIAHSACAELLVNAVLAVENF